MKIKLMYRVYVIQLVFLFEITPNQTKVSQNRTKTFRFLFGLLQNQTKRTEYSHLYEFKQGKHVFILKTLILVVTQYITIQVHNNGKAKNHQIYKTPYTNPRTVAPKTRSRASNAGSRIIILRRRLKNSCWSSSGSSHRGRRWAIAFHIDL